MKSKHIPFSKGLARDLEAGITNIKAKYEWSGRGDYRSDLSAYVSNELCIRKEYADDLIHAIFEIITRKLVAGERVIFPGIGAITTREKRNSGKPHNICGTIISGPVVYFKFHQNFLCKITGAASQNDKHNAIAQAKNRAWREMYSPDLHKLAFLRAEKKAGLVSPIRIPAREKVQQKRAVASEVRRASCGVLDECDKNK